MTKILELLKYNQNYGTKMTTRKYLYYTINNYNK